MSQETWIRLILWIFGIGIGITTALIRIIFVSLTARIDRLDREKAKRIDAMEKKIEERLRTLNHEDRELETRIHGLSTMLIQTLSQQSKGS